MPTLAGWYLSHEQCRAWLKANNETCYKKYPRAGAGALRLAIGRKMVEAGILDTHVEFELVPPPGWKGTSRNMPDMSLMLVRRESTQKAYIPLESNGWDKTGPNILQQNYNLEISDWRALWFDSDDPNMHTEFLSPPGSGKK
ncbi:hypothetical protein FRC12_021338 [Ceratobasidium sp. 428]|nr:hypothetical protein FRC12_021338 [Ceratobasidium sp. 428]